MTRNIKLGEIGDFMGEQVQKLVKITTLEWADRVIEETPVFSLDNYSAEELESMPMFFKVNGKTVPLKKAILNHGSGGVLRGAWQTDVSKPYVGTITNNMKYAEPVCFGNNLPASWKGQFRTRQGTRPGFPELIGKELESWTKQQYERIKRRD